MRSGRSKAMYSHGSTESKVGSILALNLDGFLHFDNIFESWIWLSFFFSGKHLDCSNQLAICCVAHQKKETERCLSWFHWLTDTHLTPISWQWVVSPVVIITLSKGFARTFPLKILYPFPWNPYLKTDGKYLLIPFLVNNFEEKEM